MKCFIASFRIQKLFDGNLCDWCYTHPCFPDHDSSELYIGAYNKGISWLASFRLVSSITGCLGSMGTWRGKVSVDYDWVCWRYIGCNWGIFDRWCYCDEIWMARFILCFSSNDFIMGDHMARKYSFDRKLIAKTRFNTCSDGCFRNSFWRLLAFGEQLWPTCIYYNSRVFSKYLNFITKPLFWTEIHVSI